MPPLLPSDPWMKAKTREITMMIAAGIQPLGNLKVQQYYSKEPKEREAWNRHFMTSGLKALETELMKYSGPYCLGEQLSLADIFLVPQVYNALRFEVKMQAFPRALAIYSHCLRDTHCEMSAPHKQAGATT
ncbi:MAG: glutathione S-transferase family protein, partial [Proteobacteria bacterium]|nr:glutathione S-transferase family protein [Pseudomonadota bacterium]